MPSCKHHSLPCLHLTCLFHHHFLYFVAQMPRLVLAPPTSCLQIKADVCPKTAENFVQLSKAAAGQGFKSSKFHRIIPNFMCQVPCCLLLMLSLICACATMAVWA